MAVTRKGNVIRMTANLDTIQLGKGGFRIINIRLVGGADASTAVIRDTDGSGHTLAVLKAAIASCNDLYVASCRMDSETLHLTLTGTAPEVYIYLE